MFHLEGKSYQEISSAVGMPENSIGPILSRARDKLRRASVNPAAKCEYHGKKVVLLAEDDPGHGQCSAMRWPTAGSSAAWTWSTTARR